MFITTLIAILIIFGILVGWVGVQHLARAYATRHPEFGPAREDGEGCGGLLCLCKNRLSCPRNQLVRGTAPDADPATPSTLFDNAHSTRKESKS